LTSGVEHRIDRLTFVLLPSLSMPQALKPHIQYLIDCRPHSIAMGNAIKWLRGQVHGLKPEAQAEEAKKTIVDAIGNFLTERITFAADYLAQNATEKVRVPCGLARSCV